MEEMISLAEPQILVRDSQDAMDVDEDLSWEIRSQSHTVKNSEIPKLSNKIYLNKFWGNFLFTNKYVT